jgi:hypothetical protein
MTLLSLAPLLAVATECRAATLQHRTLPHKPPPVGLHQGDLLEHRPSLGLLPEPSAAAQSRPQATRPTAFDPEPVLCHLPELALIAKYFIDHLGDFPDLSSGLAPPYAFGWTAPPRKDLIR